MDQVLKMVDDMLDIILKFIPADQVKTRLSLAEARRANIVADVASAVKWAPKP